MQRTIIIPLDGSELAEQAIPYAQALAESGGARLLLLRAVPGDNGAGQVGQDALVAAEAYLGELVARLGNQAGSLGQAARCGDPARIIAEASQDPQIALIVLAVPGYSGNGSGIVGESATAILRRAHAPVLLLAPDGTGRWVQGRPRRLLVPLDGSTLAETILGPAGALAADLGAAITLLRVVEASPELIGYEVSPRDPEAEIAEAQLYLEGRAAALREDGIVVDTRVEVGYPATVIVSAAREAATLVALATHGYGGAAGVTLGSIAASVVEQLDGPVLLLRPPVLRSPAGVAARVAAEVTVTFTAAELALVECGLRGLLAGDNPAGPVQALLARLATVTDRPLPLP